MRSLFPRASPTPSASTRERKSPIGCCCTGRPLAYGTRRQSSSLHGSPRCSSRRHRRRRGPPSSRRAASSPIRFRPHVAAACRPATRWTDSSPCGRRSGTASGALSRGLPRSPSVGRGVPSAASRGRGPLRARGTAGRSSPLAPSPSPRRRSRPLGRGTDHRMRFALASAGRACGCRGSVGGSSSDTSRRPGPPRISGRDGGLSSRRPESRGAHRPRCSSHPLRPGENKTAGAALSLPSGGISKSVAPFSVRWFLVLPERTRGYLAIIVAAVLFGIWPTLSKLVLNAVSPLAIAFLIQVIPGAALLLFVRRVRIHRADWKLIAVSGVVGAVIGPLIYFYGLERTTASNSVLLSNSESLFTMLLAYAFLRERATRREYVTLAGIAGGAFLVTTQLRFGDVRFLEFLVGNVMLVTAAACWGSSNTMRAVLLRRIPIVTPTTADETSFARLAELTRQLEATTKRLEKRALLAAFLRSLRRDEVAPAVYLIVGRIFAESDARALNVGWATLQKALGRTKQASLVPRTLSILEVSRTFAQIAETHGADSTRVRRRLLESLLGLASEGERDVLLKNVCGELRIGVSEGVRVEGLAAAPGLVWVAVSNA